MFSSAVDMWLLYLRHFYKRANMQGNISKDIKIILF